MGGGTGFAPLKGMIEHAFHAGIERPMHFYWGVRARRGLNLPDLPVAWVDAHPGFRYTPVLSEPDPDWQSRTGFVHKAVVADYPDMSPCDVYMSGPPPMVEAGHIAFEAHGLGREHKYSDAFEYAADSRFKPGGRGGVSAEIIGGLDPRDADHRGRSRCNTWRPLPCALALGDAIIFCNLLPPILDLRIFRGPHKEPRRAPRHLGLCR
jgi:hypothetical protein